MTCTQHFSIRPWSVRRLVQADKSTNESTHPLLASTRRSTFRKVSFIHVFSHQHEPTAVSVFECLVRDVFIPASSASSPFVGSHSDTRRLFVFVWACPQSACSAFRSPARMMVFETPISDDMVLSGNGSVGGEYSQAMTRRIPFG